jgi:hypothetical protein
MRYNRGRRTLICYAGSASEASIGSQPLGSELERYIGLLPRARQVSRPGTRDRAGRPGHAEAPDRYATHCFDVIRRIAPSETGIRRLSGQPPVRRPGQSACVRPVQTARAARI